MDPVFIVQCAAAPNFLFYWFTVILTYFYLKFKTQKNFRNVAVPILFLQKFWIQIV